MKWQLIATLAFIECATVLCSSSSSSPVNPKYYPSVSSLTALEPKPLPPPPPTSSSVYKYNSLSGMNSTQVLEHNFTKNMSNTINNFDTKLFEELVKKYAGNSKSLIFSPFSVQVALSLLYCGAAGKTANALKTGLALSDLKTNTDVANSFHYLLMPFENTGIVEIATGIYINNEYKLRSKFKSLANQFYSKVESMNFGNNIEAAKTINNFVSNATHGKITKIISSSILNTQTGMVIVNGIYFNGVWDTPFYRSQTVSGTTFYTSDTTSVKVDMMNNQDYYQYLHIKDIGVKVCQLFYKNSQMSMLIFLPDSLDGLSSLESSMSKFNYTNIINNMREENVNLYLPKFTIDFHMNLNKILTDLGMGIIFKKFDADFSDMLEPTTSDSSSLVPMYVSHVLHKAHINVNEKGTVAAAATAVGMQEGFAGAPPADTMYEVFNVNHCFTYALLNQYDVIFTGRFVGV